MSDSQSEKQFASNFLALLAVSDSNIVISADFRKDLKDISTLGIKLPNLPNPKKQLNSSNESLEQAIEVTFKSIKPPRFNVSMKTSSSNTIFEVKTALVKNQQDTLHSIDPSQIKLLVKGKVIQDSVLLSSIINGDEQVTFTVMINKDASRTSTPPSATESSSISPATSDIPLPWDEIKELLQQKGIDATKVVARLQQGWELTK